MIKQYSGGQAVETCIDWDDLDGSDTEQGLSVLCRRVLDADAGAAEYGLRLPGVVIAPDRGDRHRHACLRALALFGDGDAR